MKPIKSTVLDRRLFTDIRGNYEARRLIDAVVHDCLKHFEPHLWIEVLASIQRATLVEAYNLDAEKIRQEAAE